MDFGREWVNIMFLVMENGLSFRIRQICVSDNTFAFDGTVYTQTDVAQGQSLQIFTWLILRKQIFQKNL